MFKLDFSVQSSAERNELVTQFFEQNPNYTPSAHELETITNYILYGKDEDGTSVTDRHEVEIEPKYKSYVKRKAESLDELMEAPGFNEETIVQKYVYRKPKPHIDREADADIPNMRELWESIDHLAHILAIYSGDEEPLEGEKVPTYTPTQLYKLKHHLIDMRK